MAASIIGVSTASIDRWVHIGLLSRRLDGRRTLVRRDEIEAIAADRRRWISIATAALIARCSAHTIKSAVRDGHIVTRHKAHRRQPSLDRKSVEQFAVQHAKAVKRRERAVRAEKERADRERTLRTNPPSDEPGWIGATEAAAILGLSYNRMTQMARADRIPATKVGDRWWFRRAHIEQKARARAFDRASRS